MRFFSLAVLAVSAFKAHAASISAEVEERDVSNELQSRATNCVNQAGQRGCWANGIDISTDSDLKWPSTGVTVKYTLTVTNTTCAPDGVSRMCLLINNQFPGPTITANWGDNVQITVINKLQDNGTSFHWHGRRMLNTVGADGVNGVTQCPIAPGQNMTYSFQATEHGSSWYHSHFSVQYGDGVLGAMVFNGPASSDYDIDLGPYLIGDWFHLPSFATYALEDAAAQQGQGGPNPDIILINGTAVNTNQSPPTGKYAVTKVVAGKKYRLRVVNTSVDNFLRFSLDNHTMTVISNDFVPLKPFNATTLVVGAGMRYDVIITANQGSGSGNYWFRADPEGACESGAGIPGRAIWTYGTSNNPSVPTTSGYPSPNTCAEPAGASPYIPVAIPSTGFNSSNTLDLRSTKAQIVPGGDSLVVWALGGDTLDIQWANPTLSYVMAKNTSYPSKYAVLPVAPSGGWNYWLIQQTPNLPPIHHPIHLHGHNFWILGYGKGNYSADTANLNFQNPNRRDVTMLPAGGWLALAFKSDNPGTWLMHCHIAWHISEGFGVQFVENADSIQLPAAAPYKQVCTDWKNYAAASHYLKDDSGLYGQS